MTTLQDQVISFCKSNGIKYGFVAQKVGLEQSALSMWLHGKRNLNDFYTRQLHQYFTSPMMESDAV